MTICNDTDNKGSLVQTPGVFDEAIGTERSVLLGKVLGLLAFAFIFTGAGVVISWQLGPDGVGLGLVGSLVLLLALMRHVRAERFEG